jgi:hypothetical protein
MADYKDWYYQIANGRFPIVRGPVSLEEMGSLIQRGTIRSDTLVRFGSDTRWHAASGFVLLKRLLEPAAPYAESSRKKLPIFGLVVVTLVLIFVCFPRGREMVLKYDVLPLSERAMVSPAQGSRLSVTGIIQCTNRARAENGRLPPLSENSFLGAIASERADDMFRKQYFAHTSPSGEGATDVAQRVGYRYEHLGENIAMGNFQNDDKIVLAWMQSPGHRENILSDGCSEIGVGVKRGWMKGEEVWVAVQIFGEQSPPVAADSANRRPATYASASPGRRARKECEPPDESLRDAITKANAELSDLAEQAASLHKEISADKSGKALSVDPRDFNQKIARYNEFANEINSRKQAVLPLISDYNRTVEIYNACIAH